jgi:serine protease Do
VADSPVGTVATFDVDRGGRKMSFKMAILDRTDVFKNRLEIAGLEEEQPEPKSEAPSQAKFGIRIRALSDSERASQGLADKHGVEVIGVDADSFAEDIGIQEKGHHRVHQPRAGRFGGRRAPDSEPHATGRRGGVSRHAQRKKE